jgi:chromosome segregation ATPase
MKRDFLKNLGIEDKDIIDKILDENSSDIGRAKGELETYKNKVTELENELADKAKEITTLQGKAGNVDELNQKITQLETDKNNLTTELTTKVAQIQKIHAVENFAREQKAKNVKAVMAMLDMEKITYENDQLSGHTEQFDALKNGEDTSFLFGEVNPTPSGTHVNNPPTGNGNPPTAKSFAEAIANALNNN